MTEESKDTLAYRFAEFVANLKYEDIPGDVVAAAKSYITDWFGVALGGLGESSTDSILAVARELNGRSDSTVLGAGDKMDPTLAALVNGTMSHAIELDDDHRTMCGHPSVAVLPAVLAVCEKLGLSGKQFIESAVVGYETIIRLGTCFLGRAYYEGWHPTSTCGVFAAAASACKAMGLSAEQTATAFGLAGSMAGGTLEFHYNGTFAKRFHAGNAARNGILAAMMAKEGFTGPWKIFEGDKGFFTTHCENVAELNKEMKPVIKKIYDPSLLCDELGKRYDLLTNSFKVHCGGRFGATSIDAALEIVKKHNVKADQVKEIHVGACAWTVWAHYFEGCKRPENIVTAQFSLPFDMALVLLHRKVAYEHLRDGLYRDPQVIEIMDKVTVVVDPEAEAAYPKNYRAIVTMVLHDGTSLTASLDFPRGDPENRPTTEELHDKFRGLAGLALSKEKVEQLLKVLIDLENIDQIRQVTALAVK